MMQTRILRKSLYQINNIDETEYSQVVYERKEKLDKIELLLSEGCDEFIALQSINVARSTYYRWKNNYKKFGLAGLENESRRPNKVRKPHWSKETELRVYKLRKKYSLWGKQKLKVMYEREYKEKISQSTIGRILKSLKKRGKIKPVRLLLHGKMETKKRNFDKHAQRWQYGMKSSKPGELIQVDHMTVHVPQIGYVKHFSATCPTTKYIVYQVYREATSENAANFLDFIRNSFPFPIISLQVDGGSEFMASFEEACKKAGIPLYVLPPRSPQINGNVERTNGTAKYEFYAQYDGISDLSNLRKKLCKFSLFHNEIRPHQGIGLLTPRQFFDELKNKMVQSHMY